MPALTCEMCKEDITYTERIQRLDLAGYTHTYCKNCGDKLAKEEAPKERDL